MLTIRDITEQICELQGYIKVQRWANDEPEILFEGYDLWNLKDEYKDMEITFIYSYDTGKNPAICIELYKRMDSE